MIRLMGLICGIALIVPAVFAQEPLDDRIDQLIGELSDTQKREKAQEGLKKIGERAIPELVKTMAKHQDRRVRAEAREVLKSISESKAIRLIALLGDKAAQKRESAQKALTKLLDEGAEEVQQAAARAALLAAMKSKDATIRKSAEGVLTKAYAPRIAKMVKQLGADAFEKRESATRQLLELETLALPGLRQALNDPDLEIARRARKLVEEISRRKQ